MFQEKKEIDFRMESKTDSNKDIVKINFKKSSSKYSHKSSNGTSSPIYKVNSILKLKRIKRQATSSPTLNTSNFDIFSNKKFWQVKVFDQYPDGLYQNIFFGIIT